MTAQEPVNAQDFISSFKGFMDKAVAQTPAEEPVFLRSLRTHFIEEALRELVFEGGELTKQLLGASRAF